MLDHSPFSFEFRPRESSPDRLEDAESASHDVWLVSVREKLFDAFPHLEQVYLSVALLPFDESEHSGMDGFFSPTQENGDGVIDLAMVNEIETRQTQEKNPIATEIIAQRLGIPVSAMNAEVANTFMLLHEYGHAQDYYVHYRHNPDFADVPEDRLGKLWVNDYEQQKATLPFGFMDKRDYLTYRESHSFAGFLAEHPDTDNFMREHGITTEQALIDARYRLYRDMPAEKFADEFAADFIHAHMPEILRDSEV